MTSLSKNTLTTLLVTAAILCALVLAYMFGGLTHKAGASAGALIGNVASSSLAVSVGTTSAVTLFANSTQCSSRVISTVGVPIMLSFSTSTADSARNAPNATYGVLQAASTTVVYDAGLYGCPVVTAWGYPINAAGGGSSTITVAEFR